MMEIWLLVFFCPVNPRDSSGKAIIPLKYFIFSLLHIGKHSIDVKWHLKKRVFIKSSSLYMQISPNVWVLCFSSPQQFVCYVCIALWEGM